MPTSSSGIAPRRVLKGRTKTIGTLSGLCGAHYIKYCNMIEEMLCFIEQRAADHPWLPTDSPEMGLLPIE